VLATTVAADPSISFSMAPSFALKTPTYRHQQEWQRCVRFFFFVLRLIDGAENASAAWKRIFFVRRVPTILEIFTRSPLSFSTTKFEG
jgi:hypothetical protein